MLNRIFSFLLILALDLWAGCISATIPTDYLTVDKWRRAGEAANWTAIKDAQHDCADSLNQGPLTRIVNWNTALQMKSLQDLGLKLDDDNNGAHRFAVLNGAGDTVLRVGEDFAAKFFGPLSVAGAISSTGAMSFPSLSASLPLALNSSKEVINGAVTGTGTTMVLSVSPSITGTLAAVNGTYSGTLAALGMATFGATGSHAQNLLLNGYMDIQNDAGNSAEIELTTTGGTGSPKQWRILSLGSVQSAFGPAGSFALHNQTDGVTAFTLSAAGALAVPSLTLSSLAGTGTRITTSTSAGVQGNATTISGANTWSDKQTHTTAPRFNSVSASEILMSDGSKDLASIGSSGTGNVVRVTNAVLVTPTLGVAAATRIATSSNTNSVVVAAATDAASSLQVGGSYSEAVESRTANVTLDLSQSTIEANATGGNFTLALPAASGCIGRRYTIHKNDASTNTVTIDANASETIGGALTIVLGGNVGNSRLVIKSNGTTWRIEDLYEEGTFTAAATGMSACTNGALVGSTCTATAYYTRTGKSIHVYVPDLLGTSSSTSLTVTGLPSFLNASRSQTINLPAVVNNSQNYSGFVILTTGTFTLSFRTTFVDYPSNVFTASGFKGCNSFNFTYTLQ